MNLDRLNALNDMLDQADIKIRTLEETAKFMQPIDRITGSDSSALFQRRAASTRAAKRRILQSIYDELIALKITCKLEIEASTPALPSDLAHTSTPGAALQNK